MKKSFFTFILLIFLSSCTSINITPTTIIPSVTISPTNTPTSTLTYTPLPPSPTLEPPLFVFDIALDAPLNDVTEIKLGLDLVRAYLRDFMTGDIELDKQNFIVKIVM